MSCSSSTYLFATEIISGILKDFKDIILKNNDSELLGNNSASSDSENVATPKEYSYRYYYRISAENVGRGLESSPFTNNLNSDTEGLGWLLPPPQNIEVSKGKDPEKIFVSWDGVPDAKYYRIYKKG